MKARKLLFPVCFALLCMALSTNTAGNTIPVGDEIAYLHTDRNLYIAGEEVFFKLYLIDATTHKLSQISTIAYMVLRNNAQIPYAQIKLKAEGGIAYGSISLPDSLKSGTYQFTVFTNWMRNAGEGSFFTKELFIANRFDKDLSALSTSAISINPNHDSTNQKLVGRIPISIMTDKTGYDRREKINLSLDFDSNLLNDSANLSVSVTEDIPGTGTDFSIVDYLRLKSHQAVFGRSAGGKSYSFLPERKGEIIQGKVVDPHSGQGVAGLYVFLSADDTLVNLQYCVTDTAGMFRFRLGDYYFGKDLYFSIDDVSADRNLKIITENKFGLQYKVKSSQVYENPLIKDYILKSQDIVTVSKVYEVKSSGGIIKPVTSNSGCQQLYYKPDYSVFPDEFVPLNNFTEIAKEILPPQFNLRKHNDSYTASMADENLHQFMDEEPIVFLDGVRIDDLNQLIKLGSDKVKRVDLICSRYTCGELVFPGILAVFSKNNEIKNIQHHSSSLHLQTEAFYPVTEFTPQTYTKENPSYQPDFRQLLGWFPELKVFAGHNQLPGFYASDHSGNYTVRIEGITAGGVPISISTRINVK